MRMWRNAVSYVSSMTTAVCLVSIPPPGGAFLTPRFLPCTGLLMYTYCTVSKSRCIFLYARWEHICMARGTCNWREQSTEHTNTARPHLTASIRRYTCAVPNGCTWSTVALAATYDLRERLCTLVHTPGLGANEDRVAPQRLSLIAACAPHL